MILPVALHQQKGCSPILGTIITKSEFISDRLTHSGQIGQAYD